MSATQHRPHPRAFTDAVSRSTASANRRQVFYSSPHHVSSRILMFIRASAPSLITRSPSQVISEPSSKRSSRARSSSISRLTSPSHVRHPQSASCRPNSRCFRQLAIVAKTFDPPEGQAPYSYVFDLSGEIRWDRPEQVWI